MSESKEVNITAEELKSFSEKLLAWSKTLPAKEQALAQFLLQRANASELSDEALGAATGGLGASDGGTEPIWVKMLDPIIRWRRS